MLVSVVGQCVALLQAPPRCQGNLKPYCVHLRSSLPIAAYRGGFAVYQGGWQDDDRIGNASLPAILTATPATVAAEARSMIGRGIPRCAQLAMKNLQIRAHSKSMDYQQMQVAAFVGLSMKDLTYSCKYAMNGFAGMLTPWHVWKLRRHAAVAAVVECRQLQKMTTYSPMFLDMVSGIWSLANTGPSNTGDNVVIGMIDPGIWPEHPSFDDKGMR
ncbi:unnamed protein product [Closterium sp. NIES-53]